MYRYVDVHSHVALDMFGTDSDEVICSMCEQGIATIVVGVDRLTSEQALACAQRHENVFATIGVHPSEAFAGRNVSGGDISPSGQASEGDGKREVFDENIYGALVKNPKVVAIGECGLDYYRLSGEETPRRKDEQHRLFEQQIRFAVKHDKPLMLHGRPSKGSMDAYEDMLSLLARYKEMYGEKLRGNAHFFVGTPDIAQRFFALNFTVSFSGVITFASEYDATVRAAPQGMIHAETDSPYAAPHPHRGKRNDPRFLPTIVGRLAELRGEDEEVLRTALRENAARVFGV